MSSKDAQILRERWSEERAYRTGMPLTMIGLVLGTLGTFLDLVYMDMYVVAGDFVMLGGCLLSLVLTRRQFPRRRFIWWPLYAGFLISTVPMIWATGGVNSQWLGLLLAVTVVMGTVVQVKINPLYNLAIAFAYLLFWLAWGSMYGIPVTANSPPVFSVALTALCLMGIGYCVYSLLRTENALATEISKQYDELYAARERLAREENANQVKTIFLTNMSHELRTPLSSILGYSDLLQDGLASEEEKRQFLEIIQRNGLQLAQLVDDLLDVSKVEAGRLELEKTEVEVLPLVSEVLKQIVPVACKKGIKIETDLQSPVPEVIVSDAARIKQVLQNVIGNAVKFTGSGSVKVILSFMPRRPLFGELVIRVRDTGCGISRHETEKLFHAFSQTDASMARRYGGTGLGLNLSRGLARLMGGDLGLTWSQPGQGSEFTFCLPVEVQGNGFTSKFPFAGGDSDERQLAT